MIKGVSIPKQFIAQYRAVEAHGIKLPDEISKRIARHDELKAGIHDKPQEPPASSRLIADGMSPDAAVQEHDTYEVALAAWKRAYQANQDAIRGIDNDLTSYSIKHASEIVETFIQPEQAKLIAKAKEPAEALSWFAPNNHQGQAAPNTATALG